GDIVVDWMAQAAESVPSRVLESYYTVPGSSSATPFAEEAAAGDASLPPALAPAAGEPATTSGTSETGSATSGTGPTSAAGGRRPCPRVLSGGHRGRHLPRVRRAGRAEGRDCAGPCVDACPLGRAGRRGGARRDQRHGLLRLQRERGAGRERAGRAKPDRLH